MKQHGKYNHLKDEWITLYNKGLSLNKIAMQYSVSRTTVKNLIKNDIELKKHAGKYDHYISTWTEEYNAGATIQQIAKKYNTYHNTVKMILLKNGVELHTDTPSVYLIYQTEWSALYKDGQSLMTIAKKYNVSPDTVKSIILPHLDTRNYIESSSLTPMKVDYFSAIDTEEKAYWLGFCFASGYISQKRRTDQNLKVVFIFKQRELHIAEALKSILQTSKAVTFSEEENLTRLEFIDTAFIETLTIAGMKPNDKHHCAFPSINSNLQIPFIIGFFDKRVKMAESRIYIHAPMEIVSAIHSIFKSYGINGEVRQSPTHSWGTLNPIDSRKLAEKLMEYHHLIKSSDLKFILELILRKNLNSI